MKLTPKQEKFAKKYIELGNASEAYRQAYTWENMSDEMIWTEASKVLNSPKVSQRVKELQERIQKRHDVTVDSITAELEEARALAKEEKQAASMVSASNSKAKLHGLLNEKLEVDGELRLTINKTVRSARDND